MIQLNDKAVSYMNRLGYKDIVLDIEEVTS